jgi:hypothetical protein
VERGDEADNTSAANDAAGVSVYNFVTCLTRLATFYSLKSICCLPSFLLGLMKANNEDEDEVSIFSLSWQSSNSSLCYCFSFFTERPCGLCKSQLVLERNHPMQLLA